MPSSGSWQDLKDHFREAGDVSFSDVFKDKLETEGPIGVVEFINKADMKYAMDKLDNTKFKSHDGEVSYVTLHQDHEGEYANRSSRGYQMQVEKFRGRGAPRGGGRGRGRGDYYGGYF